MEATKLPIITIFGSEWFCDERLREYRAVYSPHNVMSFDRLDTIWQSTLNTLEELGQNELQWRILLKDIESVWTLGRYIANHHASFSAVETVEFLCMDESRGFYEDTLASLSDFFGEE